MFAASTASAQPHPYGDEDDSTKTCFVLTLDSQRVAEPTGTSVASRTLTPPRNCRALSTKVHAPYREDSADRFPDDEQSGLKVYESAADFRKRVGCAPPKVDFRRERIAIFWVDDDATTKFRLDRVVTSGDFIEAVIRVTRGCTKGKRKEAKRVVMFTVPAGDALVESVICPTPAPTCP